MHCNEPAITHVACHRVIMSDGKIGGFNGGTRRKKRLLRSEGIEISGNKIDLIKYGFKF